MTLPMTYSQAVDAVNETTAEIRSLEDEHRKAGEEYAAAEATYRRELGASYVAYRALGKAQEEASTMARADCATHSNERDRTKHRVANLAEQLEDRRGERASLHRLLDWSASIDARQVAA